jgi:hypothetical protein
MKTLILALLITPLSALSADFILEPYADAQYACNYFEGESTRLVLNADTLEQAVVEAQALIGKNLQMTCNQDEYACVHKNGDVEPRVIRRHSTERNVAVIGGSIKDLATGKEIQRVNSAYYHRNLRRMPRCDY